MILFAQKKIFYLFLNSSISYALHGGFALHLQEPINQLNEGPIS